MCIAIPMQIDAIDATGESATVSLAGNRLQIDISLLDPKVGDYVLVHAGCALEIVSKDTAKEIQDLFNDLAEMAADERT